MLRLIRFNWKLAATAFGIVVVTRLLLWAVPFRWVRRLADLKSASLNAPGDLGRRRRIAAAVRIVSRSVPGATCLTQALAAQTILRLKGDNVPLQLGVSWSKNGIFEAHAWLESEGKVLIGDLPDLERYKKLGNALATT